jgi:hypothetical protein
MTLQLGVDPGQVCGVFALRQGRYDSHLTVTKPQRRVREDVSDQELRYVAKLTDALATYEDATLVVIERPADGAAFWQGQGQKGQRRGTAFALGTHYLATLIAVQQACRRARIVTYPVLGNNTERGWMPRRTSRTLLLQILQSTLTGMGAPRDLPEHCVMGGGVLLTHRQRTGEVAA